uniref:Glutaredoxin domain-containing protein n=1 Tax=Chenopodium quinoa TaxID=63459 RepID=A0A803MUA5_CHEQI
MSPKAREAALMIVTDPVSNKAVLRPRQIQEMVESSQKVTSDIAANYSQQPEALKEINSASVVNQPGSWKRISRQSPGNGYDVDMSVIMNISDRGKRKCENLTDCGEGKGRSEGHDIEDVQIGLWARSGCAAALCYEDIESFGEILSFWAKELSEERRTANNTQSSLLQFAIASTEIDRRGVRRCSTNQATTALLRRCSRFLTTHQFTKSPQHHFGLRKSAASSLAACTGAACVQPGNHRLTVEPRPSVTDAVIFTKSSDCMSHSIKSLFYELGASPAVYEIDRDPRGRELEMALQRLGCKPTVPAIFIGGMFVGSAKDVLAAHLTGSLKDMLIAAKAIWF